MKASALVLVAVLTMAVEFSASAANVWVVGNGDFPDDSVTSSQVKSLYLGDLAETASGKLIEAFDRKRTPKDLRSKFFTAVTGFSPTQFKAYWSRRIFTGRGYPPAAVGSLSDLMESFKGKEPMVTFAEESEIEPPMKRLLKVEIPD